MTCANSTHECNWEQNQIHEQYSSSNVNSFSIFIIRKPTKRKKMKQNETMEKKGTSFYHQKCTKPWRQ